MIDIEAGMGGLTGLNASLTRGSEDCLCCVLEERESLLRGCGEEFCRGKSLRDGVVGMFERNDASAANEESPFGDKA